MRPGSLLLRRIRVLSYALCLCLALLVPSAAFCDSVSISASGNWSSQTGVLNLIDDGDPFHLSATYDQTTSTLTALNFVTDSKPAYGLADLLPGLTVITNPGGVFQSLEFWISPGYQVQLIFTPTDAEVIGNENGFATASDRDYSFSGPPGVPEPSAILLFGSAMICVLVRRMRKTT